MKRWLLYLLLSTAFICSLFVNGCQYLQQEKPISINEGDVLNLFGIDPFTLDPAISSDATSHQYVMQLFSGLVRFDDNLQPVPDIAKDWHISDDGLTYTFFLRNDVKFHDGEPVTSQDLKYSWERACYPSTRSMTAATFLGDIVGVAEVLVGKSDDISGIEVVDDYTLKVNLDAPKSYFLSKIAYPTAFVVDSVNVSSKGEWWRRPNGTGPFKLDQWDENNLLVLERNDLYYGTPTKVDSVIFKLWGGIPMNMYEAGEIDIANVSINYIDKVTDETGPFYQDLEFTSELSLFYIGFNCVKPPFDDVNIRQAFSQAIDRDKLVSLVFRNMVKRANSILPPDMPGYNHDLVGVEFDATRAKALIMSSEYGDVSNLPPIWITTSGWGGTISPELEAIIHEWRQNLGVEVKVRQLEPERFVYHLKQEKDEMFYTGWIADYPHPHGFLDILFRSDADNNFGEYKNPEVDMLLDMASVEFGDQRNLTLYKQAEQVVISDFACIPLWFGQNYSLIKPYVDGYRLDPLGRLVLDSVSVKRN